MQERSNLIRGPYLSLDMPFRLGESEGEFFPDIPLGFQRYRHQERAFQRIAGNPPRSTIIATGTGSGKTECFSWPILDHLHRNRTGQGIVAILIYPMNALAEDQARRLASVIWKTPGLKGRTRVGLYVHGEPKGATTTMTDEKVITNRDEMRRSPPDILITNYKMLDYLLVRPRDKNLFAKSHPKTLRFLIVDELHTFDGAQGTDLACLIRRLKARLGSPPGHLCCVGTSATLGEGSSERIRNYASQVFGEEFDSDAVVSEDRISVNEYLSDKDITETNIPKPSELEIALEEERHPSSLIGRLHSLWFGQEHARDVMDAKWRVGLSSLLQGHVFFHTLLRANQGKPTSYADICDGLSRVSYLSRFQARELELLIGSMAALISHARLQPEATVGGNGSGLRPLMNLRVQLWLRELRRMVASVCESPELRYHDDLSGRDTPHLPTIHCRECGESGWACVQRVGRNRLGQSASEIYREFFASNSPTLRFLLGSPPPDAEQSSDKVSVCTKCLTHAPEAGGNPSCASCGDEDRVVAYLYCPQRFEKGQTRVNKDCPYCGNSEGIHIVGVRSTTMLGAAQAVLFGSAFNDDPKLLAFSDSVQDAALRAGFFEARSFTNVFRSALRRSVAEQGSDRTMEELLKQFPASLRADGDAHFVATYIPHDLQWRHDFTKLLEEGKLAPDSFLPRVLETRCRFEAFAELTFRSQYTHALETLGLICVHPDIKAIESAARELGSFARDKLGDSFAQRSESDWFAFLLGLMDGMRKRGAVLSEPAHGFLRSKANWYAYLKSHKLWYTLPRLAPGAPKPKFPANRRRKEFDSIADRKASKNWYAAWANKHFWDHGSFAPGSYRDLYTLAFKALEQHGLVQRHVILEHAREFAWGLHPAKLHVTGSTRQVQCNACNLSHSAPEANAQVWQGMHCPRYSCNGKFRLSARPSSKSSVNLTYGGDRIRRVIAREHTGLLTSDRRAEIEQGFMKDVQHAWDPNLLSATSTLELGIDIGDLSSLILCSVPPRPSNYIQRIGRSGRRDGNSLNITVAAGRAHDLYFWEDPMEMLSGAV
ncbi:MAG: DEAD/DEAH box helicase, partial [Rhodobacteraceae bacterium]|nr:DEAD/DEAH box helicase [Paracoccaceae bacterium]